MHEMPTYSIDPSCGMTVEEVEPLKAKLKQEFSQSEADQGLQTSLEDHLEGEKNHETKHVPTSL